MFHLTENVVWDDNFKRPLKVYTKPRSLLEVHSYLYMHKILALWIYCYLVHRTVIFYVTTYLFHISIKIYIYINIHKVRLSSFMHVCKYSYVITDNINQISVTIYMRPITKTLRKADFLLFQILTTIRFDELFSCYCKLNNLLFFLKKFRKELYIHLFCLIIIFSTYSWKWFRLTEKKKPIWIKLFWLIENRIWMKFNIIQAVNERRRRYVAPKSKKGTYKDLIGHGGSVIDRKVCTL